MTNFAPTPMHRFHAVIALTSLALAAQGCAVVTVAGAVAGIEDRGAFDVAKKTRQWLKAIYAYLMAQPAVSNRVPDYRPADRD